MAAAAAAELREDDWTFFSQNARPYFDENTRVWCEVSSVAGGQEDVMTIRKASTSKTHAVNLVLAELSGLERADPLKKLTLYTSSLPCVTCALEIVYFAEERPHLIIEVICTAVFCLDNPEQCGSLECFEMYPQIQVRAVAMADWKHLALRRHQRKPLNQIESEKELMSRETWDEVFSEQLQTALRLQYGLPTDKEVLHHDDVCKLYRARLAVKKEKMQEEAADDEDD